MKEAVRRPSREEHWKEKTENRKSLRKQPSCACKRKEDQVERSIENEQDQINKRLKGHDKPLCFILSEMGSH